METNIINVFNLGDLAILTYTLKNIILFTGTYYTYQKLLNTKNIFNINFLFVFILTIITTIIGSFIRTKTTPLITTVCITILLNIIYSFICKNKFGYSLLITVTSLSINFITFNFSAIINWGFNILISVQNDYLNLFFISLIYIIILYFIFKIRKFKNGLAFFKKNLNDEYFDMFILHISVAIIFSSILLSSFNLIITTNSFFYLAIFSIIALVTIQRTLTMYYKHKLLVTELNDTKAELEKKNKEIVDLEAENLEFSKTAHSIAHKQKSLEHKLNELMLQTEFADELDIRDRLNDISKECYTNTSTTPLPKTDIDIIDDMLSYMQSECKENNIDFELQLNGNIHHMINTLVTKEELEILLADHIKDAIIAINYSDNVNKSILVKLGLFDGDYSLSIYDSGIEFEIPTLINLGIKPSTTHKDDGGTGMGFMNTFDTLRKHSASLYINEIGKPSKDNYTKSVSIKFNNKNEYTVSSYRANEIKEKNNRNDLTIE